MKLSRQSLRNRGVALVIMLFFLALLTVMVIGYLDTSRLDRGQSSSHLERVRAGVFAREGIERTVAVLQRETVNPPRYTGETDVHYQARRRHWISQPGQLIVPDEPAADPADISVDQKQLRRRVELSSGVPDAAVSYSHPVLHPANLNTRLFTDQTTQSRLITSQPLGATGAPPDMKLRWIYVRANAAGGRAVYDDSENPDLTNTAQPLIGRFAWWVDDESTKINYNLAWKRSPAASASPNRHPASHPSTINLMALRDPAGAYLPETLADAMHAWTLTTPKRYFNSFADARQLEETLPGISAVLAHNQFELTHYNHDPDSTFFGEERILLTTNRDLVPRNPDGSYARRFLDIMRDDLDASVADPGIREHIAGGQEDWDNGRAILPNKFDAAVRMVIRYLSTKDWPVAPGVSFKDKYYPGSLDTDVRLGQIAANLIDYVRAKESAQPVIAPLRFGLNTSGKYSLHNEASTSATSMQGVGRAPLITEIGAWLEQTAEATSVGHLYPIHFRIEIHLPEGYHLPDGIDLVPDPSPNPSTSSRGWFLGITETSNGQYYWRSPAGNLVKVKDRVDTIRILKDEITGGEGSNGTVLMPGKYVTVTKKFYRTDSWSDDPTISTRAAIYQNALGAADQFINTVMRWPRVCIFPQIQAIPIQLSNPASSTMETMTSCQTNDPRCGVHPNDWVKNIPNTYGAVNSTLRIGQPPNIASNLPQQDTDAAGGLSSHSLYMPPPKGTGTNGPQGDDGRLTSIGEMGYVNTGVNAVSGSVSWRSIRLQPNRYTTTDVLPDWLLMDLFSVPNTGMNGSDHLYQPHGTAVGGRININARITPFPALERRRGLVALLLGAGRVNSTEHAESIGANIHDRVLSGIRHGSFGKAYGYPWGGAGGDAYDTPGEICEIEGVADGGEQDEDRVRSIASLITTRGGVFGVYTIGQSLRQSRNGDLLVTGEQRMHAMVERYVNNFGTQTEADDRVQFRTVYLRQLNP